MAHKMQPNGATDLIKPDTTILFGFLVHIIGRLIIVDMVKQKDGNAMIILLASPPVISGRFTFAKIFVCLLLVFLAVDV